MLRKWMLAIIAATTLIFGANPTSVHAQTKPGAMASPPAGKMAKKMPPRDAKGRFMKTMASPSPSPMKKMPMRDAKGRFMKASPSPSPAGKMAKKMPPRDAKGRFMKTMASPSPAPK